MFPLFASLYSKTGRPSIAPEKLLPALLLQMLHSIRSERLLMEQLDYNLLFRWFVGRLAGRSQRRILKPGRIGDSVKAKPEARPNLPL
jgi:transposase